MAVDLVTVAGPASNSVVISVKQTMQTDIPEEQWTRLAPVVEALLAKLNTTVQTLPPATESALEYSPDLGSPE
jgi:hypothetical protein